MKIKDDVNSLNYKQIIKKQYAICAQDPVYFMKNYCYIQHPIQGIILFQLYEFQQKTLKSFLQHSWNIILKSRQMGISSLVSGYSLWRMVFMQGQNILVLANRQQVAVNIIKKVAIMRKHLPSWMKPILKVDNRCSLQFDNFSTIKAQSATASAGVSQALSLLIWDECAVTKPTLANQIWGAAAPTLSCGGDCIILSTPRGCVLNDTKVTVRNKYTKQIKEITIGQLYNIIT